jgi:hypothetical protein
MARYQAAVGRLPVETNGALASRIPALPRPFGID